LAARRKDRVIGRTQILVVSIKVRKGFSHLGAPPGSRLARESVGEARIPEIIKASHSGRPNERVNKR